MIRVRLLLLLLMLLLGTTSVATAQSDNDPARNFRYLWWVLRLNYPFFQVRNVSWNKTYRKYRAKINKNTSEKELYCLLTDMIGQMGDGHVSLNAYDYDRVDCPSYSPAKEAKLDWDELGSQIATRQLTNEQDYLDGTIRWGRLKEDPRIGYIQINELEDLDNCPALRALHSSTSDDDDDSDDDEDDEDDEETTFSCDTISNEEAASMVMASILKGMKNTKGIILDLRLNSGGEDEAALAMLSHFNTKRRLAFIKQELDYGRLRPKKRAYIEAFKQPYTKKVMLLTSRQTQSAAEIMALAARQIPTIQLVGSRTQGILSNLSWGYLPIGWWYTYSDETYYSPKGKVYEKVGIPPHHSIAYPRKPKALYRALNRRNDIAIRKAIQLIQ